MKIYKVIGHNYESAYFICKPFAMQELHRLFHSKQFNKHLIINPYNYHDTRFTYHYTWDPNKTLTRVCEVQEVEVYETFEESEFR